MENIIWWCGISIESSGLNIKRSILLEMRWWRGTYVTQQNGILVKRLLISSLKQNIVSMGCVRAWYLNSFEWIYIMIHKRISITNFVSEEVAQKCALSYEQTLLGNTSPYTFHFLFNYESLFRLQQREKIVVEPVET